MDNWGAYLKDFLAKNDIKQIFLLSDARPMHSIAIEIAKELNILAYVFEQGYSRPNRITLELYGVNGNTNLPKCEDIYRKHILLANKVELAEV